MSKNREEEKIEKLVPETKQFKAGKAADAPINMTIGMPHTKKVKMVTEKAIQAFFADLLKPLVSVSNDLQVDRIIIDFSNTEAENVEKTGTQANMIFVDLNASTIKIDTEEETKNKEEKKDE